MGKRSAVKVNVLVDEGCPSVLRDLENAGFHVTEMLAEIGVVVGSGDSTELDKLRDIPGVLAVEPSREVGSAQPLRTSSR